MTSEHLTDRMPDVVHGRESWTFAEQSHLLACADCAAEWRVVSAVQLADRLPSVDTAALAVAVLDRLRNEPTVLPFKRRTPWRRGLVSLVAAASIALAFLLWPATPATERAFVPSREPTMLPELDQLLEAELEVVLAAVTAEVADPIGTVPRLGDLTDEELETLLEEVEG